MCKKSQINEDVIFPKRQNKGEIIPPSKRPQPVPKPAPPQPMPSKPVPKPKPGTKIILTDNIEH